MSNAKGHIAGGAITGGLVAGAYAVLPLDISAYATGTEQTYVFFAVLTMLGVVFGLFPDIDTNSKGQDLFISGLFVIDIYLIFSKNYTLASYIGLLAMLPILGKHRGWTHSKRAMLIIPAPLVLLPLFGTESTLLGLPYYVAAVAGYASHLVLDREFF